MLKEREARVGRETHKNNESLQAQAVRLIFFIWHPIQLCERNSAKLGSAVHPCSNHFFVAAVSLPIL